MPVTVVTLQGLFSSLSLRPTAHRGDNPALRIFAHEGPRLSREQRGTTGPGWRSWEGGFLLKFELFRVVGAGCGTVVGIY